MKKILVCVALIVSAATVNAQSFRVGLAGAFNSTWLLNKNVSDAGDELDYKASFGGQFGLSSLYNFKENVGVSLDILFLSSVNQKYTNRQGGNNYVTETKMKFVTIPLMFRYTGAKGPYFEIGPEFSFRGKVKSVVDGDSETLDKDVADKLFNKSSIAAALGFGVDIAAGDKVDVTIGFRFAYGFTDITKEPDFSTNYEPTNTIVGGLHLGVAYKIFNKAK